MGNGCTDISYVLLLLLACSFSTLFVNSFISDAPRYSEELKEMLACQVMGVKLLLGEEQAFDAEETYRLACKV